MTGVKVAKPTSSVGPSKTSKRILSTKNVKPPTSEMVIVAIKALDDKKGSSLQSIKKYIASHYVCDIEKQAIFIRKFINSAVEKNILIRTKGIGASGSFKLQTDSTEKVKKAEKNHTKTAKKASTDSKKPKANKKSGEKENVAVSAKNPKEAKLPTKVKKSGKVPTAKPRTPKAKKAAGNK